MPSISGSFIFLCCLQTSQLLCSAVPIVLEMTHTNPSTGQVVQTDINVDDSVIEKVLLERVSNVGEARNMPDTKEDSIYDYYDFDCAMPIMPEILHEKKKEETLKTRQVDRPRAYNVMDSIVGGLNGIAMSVAAAGIGVYNFFRFN